MGKAENTYHQERLNMELGNVIDKFDGEYRFLSNFYPSEIKIIEITHPTLEHAYQAYKTKDINERVRISKLKTPGQAKRAGQKLIIREDWDNIKIKVMKCLLYIKFCDKVLNKKLLDTGDAFLIEGNTWGDIYWGMCKGKGENMLGKLLMSVREEFRQSPIYFKEQS